MANEALDKAMQDLKSGAFNPSAPPSDASPGLLDQAVKQTANLNQRSVALTALQGSRANPDQYQAHKSLADAFGVGVDFAARNREALDPIKRKQDLAAFLDKSPAIAAWYAEGDNPAAIKFDELEHLQGLDWLWNSAVQSFGGGSNQVKLAQLRSKQMYGSATPEEIAAADQLSASMGRDYGAEGWLEKGWVGMFGQLPILGTTIVDAASSALATGLGFAGVAAMGGQLGPQVATPEELVTVPGAFAAGVTVGGTWGAWQSSFKLEAPLAYDEFLQFRDETGAPLDPVVARTAALIAGMGAASLETASDLVLAKIVPGLDKLMSGGSRSVVKAALRQPSVRQALLDWGTNVFKAGVTEVSTETIQEAVTVFAGEAAKAYANTSGAEFAAMTPEEVGARLLSAAEQTAQTMTFLGPILAGTRLGADVSRARAAKRDQLMLQALGDSAANDQLLKRLPEKAREAIKALTANGPVQTAYLSPDGLRTFFQDDPAAIGEFARQIDLVDEVNEALATGRDIRIPIETYYTKIAGTDMHEAIRAHVRLSQENMTAASAADFDEAWAEAVASLQADYQVDIQDNNQALAAEEIVFEDVKSKAMNAGITPDQANQYAKLYSTFFRVMGERSGVAPDELYKRYNLDIKRALPEETQYRPVGSTDLDLAVIRAGKIEGMRKAVNKAAGPSLTDFLKSYGGVVDEGGDLAAMGLKGKAIAKAASEGNRNTLDDFARHAWESGFFPEFQERPTPNQVLDALREDVGGNKRRSVEMDQSGRPDIARQAAIVAFADTLDQLGLDVASMTDEQIKAELERIVNEDPNSAAYAQFAGFMANPADPERQADAVSKAVEMEREGWGPQAIFDETGFFRGADKAWRFEISDADAKLKEEAFAGAPSFLQRAAGMRDGGSRWVGQGTQEVVLSDILDHPLLFDAYPFLKNYRVKAYMDPRAVKEYSGYHDHTLKMINAEARDMDTLLSVILHEVAHAIQQYEGFSNGGNLSSGKLMEGDNVEGLKAAIEGIKRKLAAAEQAQTDKVIAGGWDAVEGDTTVEDLIARLFDFQRQLSQAAGYEFYRRIAGEVEARNVQKRWQISKTEPNYAKNVPPWISQDVSPDQVIVVRSDKHAEGFDAMSIPESIQGEFDFSAPAQEPAARSIYRDIQGNRVQFEDEYQAEVYSLGERLLATNDLDAEAVDLGDQAAEAQRLADTIGPYLDPPATTPEAMARAAMEIADSEQGNVKEGATLSIIDGSSRGEWSQFVARELREQLKRPMLYQQEKRTKRGSIQFHKGATIINMFESANLSTFLHESGHFFLEVFKDLATQEGAAPGIAKDWEDLKAYLKVDGDTIPEEAHETFARSFEAYLFEGKAPSGDVADIMARFRSWLVFVYKQITALRAPINDKVRGVMDRMIATDKEIAAVQTAPEFRPAFKNAADAGMTDAQWEDYLATAGRAVNRAKRELDAKFMAELARETTREYQAAKKEIRAQVQAELEKLPGYQALAYLRTGVSPVIPDGTPRMYLDRDAIISIMGEGALLRLPRSVPPIYRTEGGVHPDTLAELFGFPSGSDMLTRIMSMPPLGRAIVEETQLRLRQRFGDLRGDANARIREAEAATATDETGQLLAVELEVLMRKGLVTTSLNKAAAQRAAKQMIRDKPIREAIQIRLYMNANSKAAQETEKAIMKGDWPAAVAAKQRQLLNHYLVLEARAAMDATTKAQRYLSKFTGRKRVTGIAPEYLDQIETLLERFDLRKSITLRDSQRRASLRAWIEDQEAQGILVNVPEALRDDAFRKPYRDMTVDDLLGLTDTVRSIEHIGRTHDKLRAQAQKEKFDKVRDEILTGLASSQEVQKGSNLQNPSKGDQVVSLMRGLDAALLKMEQIITWMDGGDINGPLRRHIWQPIADAEARENDMREKYTAKIFEIMSKLDKGRLQERITVDAVATTFLRSEIVALALNLGNAGNKSKLNQSGNGRGPWTDGDIASITRHLNAEEWQAVQSIWDAIDELWPEVAAIQKRLSGVAPPKIEATPVETPFGTLRGGYYPIVYDPNRAPDVADRAAVAADKLFENTYLKPETAHGFTKERVTNYTRPLLLDLDRAAAHIVAVIHDVTHREAIMDAHKLLTDKAVRADIEARYGRELYQQFVPWLQSIAHDNVKNDGLTYVNRVLRGIRSRATMVGMGFRITTIITQVAGLLSMAEMVPARWMAAGLGEFVRNPLAANAKVSQLSAEMRHRGKQMDRDIRDELRRLSGKTGPLDAARRFAFHGIAYMDKVVTVPGWLGAYGHHLQAYPGDVKGAVAAADRAVRLTQGSGGAKDLAAITRQNEATKLVTMFYSYFSAYYNRQRAWGRDAKRAIEAGEFADFPSLLARQVFMTIGPALVAELIVGQGPGEDEPWEQWAAKKVALYPFMAMPIVRDAISALGSGFGYTFTPAGRTIQELLVDPATMIKDAVEGDLDPRKAVKQAITTVGYALNLPVGQLASTVDNVWKGIEEDDFSVRDLVLNRPK